MAQLVATVPPLRPPVPPTTDPAERPSHSSSHPSSHSHSLARAKGGGSGGVEGTRGDAAQPSSHALPTATPGGGGGGRQSRGTVPIAFQQRLQAARDSLGVRVRPRKKTEGGDIAATREGSGVLGRAGL